MIEKGPRVPAFSTMNCAIGSIAVVKARGKQGLHFFIFFVHIQILDYVKFVDPILRYAIQFLRAQKFRPQHRLQARSMDSCK